MVFKAPHNIPVVHGSGQADYSLRGKCGPLYFCEHRFLQPRQAHLFPYCGSLFLYYSSRVEWFWKRPSSPQSLKYLLFSPLQRKFAGPWSRRRQRPSWKPWACPSLLLWLLPMLIYGWNDFSKLKMNYLHYAIMSASGHLRHFLW